MTTPRLGGPLRAGAIVGAGWLFCDDDWTGDPAAACAAGVCWMIVTGGVGEGTMTVGRLGDGGSVGSGGRGGMGRPRKTAAPSPPMSFPRHPAAIRITPRRPLPSIIHSGASIMFLQPTYPSNAFYAAGRWP